MKSLELYDELDALRVENAHLRDYVRTLKDGNNMMHANYDDLLFRKNKLVEENADLKEQLKEARKTCNQLQSALEVARVETRNIKSKYNRLYDLYMELQKTYNPLYEVVEYDTD